MMYQTEYLTKTDTEGVPLLVQRVEYTHSNMCFTAHMFNGDSVTLASELVSPTMGLMQLYPTHEQQVDAFARAAHYIGLHYAAQRR